MINRKADEELFEGLFFQILNRIRNKIERLYIDLSYYKCHKISTKRDGSYTYLCHSDKKATINPINGNSERISKTESSIGKYNWKGKNNLER